MRVTLTHRPFLAGPPAEAYPPAFSGGPATGPQHGSQEKRRKVERKYLRFAAAGTQYAATILLFTLGGIWLDGKFEQLSPLFLILGFLLGFAGATTSLYFQVYGSGRKK
ncbi:MAG: AtpZ/AtpI family protein [Planctomycetota bacterium]